MAQVSLRRLLLIPALAGVALSVPRIFLEAWRGDPDKYGFPTWIPVVLVVGVSIGILYGRPVFGGVVSMLVILIVFFVAIVLTTVSGP